jgi:hypothetical protein
MEQARRRDEGGNLVFRCISSTLPVSIDNPIRKMIGNVWSLPLQPLLDALGQQQKEKLTDVKK